MSNKIKVFKFGGASVKDAASIRNVGNILKNYKKESLVVVISAMGKTTNALEKVVHAYFDKNEDANVLLEKVKEDHLNIAQELLGGKNQIEKEISKKVNVVNKLLQGKSKRGYDFIYDQIVSLGELLSTTIVAAYLNQKKISTTWLDARKNIKTDNTYREGNINWELTKRSITKNVKPLLQKNGFVLTQGFIGSSKEKSTTTLGFFFLFGC